MKHQPIRYLPSILVATAVALTGCGAATPTSSPPAATNVASSTAPGADVPPATSPTSTSQTTTTALDADDASTTTASVVVGLGNRLQATLDADVVAAPDLHAELLLVRAPRVGLDWSGSAGEANPEGTPVAVDHTFRIASVTKTYTAATILRLYEQGALGLDDPISHHLPAEYVTLLRSDGYDPDVITIAMLLRHTSGIYDYAFGPGSPFLGTVFADPAHRWTSLEQVRFAVDHGQPIAAPGTVFHYSDTGYILLGQIIEVATGQPLGASFRSLLRFDRLGIAHTWLESIDPEPAGVGPRIHQYIQATDATGFDPSIDLFGGGGLVSTVADLATFFDALLAGNVFDSPATLAIMQEVPSTNAAVDIPGRPPAEAAAGLFRTTFDGLPCWGHEGFWGVSVFVCPDRELTIVHAISQAFPSPDYDPSQLGALLELAT